MKKLREFFGRIHIVLHHGNIRVIGTLDERDAAYRNMLIRHFNAVDGVDEHAVVRTIELKGNNLDKKLNDVKAELEAYANSGRYVKTAENISAAGLVNDPTENWIGGLTRWDGAI
jgi:transcription elongation factor GreA-like protein